MTSFWYGGCLQEEGGFFPADPERTSEDCVGELSSPDCCAKTEISTSSFSGYLHIQETATAQAGRY